MAGEVQLFVLGEDPHGTRPAGQVDRTEERRLELAYLACQLVHDWRGHVVGVQDDYQPVAAQRHAAEDVNVPVLTIKLHSYIRSRAYPTVIASSRSFRNAADTTGG